MPCHFINEGDTVVVEVPHDSVVWLGEARLTTWRRGGIALALVDGKQVGGLLGPVRLEARSGTEVWRLDLWTLSGRAALRDLLPGLAQVQRWFGRSRGGFWYAGGDGRSERWLDLRDCASFLADHGPEIRRLVGEIAASPATRRSVRRRIAQGGAPVDLEATRAILLRHPEWLHEHVDGPIELRGRRYTPERVVLARRARSRDTPEHRRLKALLVRLVRDVSQAMSSGLIDPESASAAELARIAPLPHRPLLDSVARERLPGPQEPRTSVEQHDWRYARLAALREIYAQRFGTGEESHPRRRNIPRDYQVFQAWCAYAVSHAFGLAATGIGFRPSLPAGPLFASADWELYHDVVPPIDSWRVATPIPDAYRPDLLLCKPDRSRVVLADAKYSRGAEGAPTAAQIKEVQAYMESFGLTGAAVLFPGSVQDDVAWVDLAAYGRAIRLIPVLPTDELNERGFLERLRAGLEGVVCVPGELFDR